jgi:hypothetical protein
MSTKIDVLRIFRQHIATLRRQGEDHADTTDLLTFFGVPLLAGILFYALAEKIKPEAANQIDSVLVAAFAVFAALLLNAQVLIIGLMREKRTSLEEKGSSVLSLEDTALLNRTARIVSSSTSELFANISYAILIALLIVFLTLMIIFVGMEQSILLKSVQFFAVIHFTLTGLMILKRLHVIFAESVA